MGGRVSGTRRLLAGGVATHTRTSCAWACRVQSMPPTFFGEIGRLATFAENYISLCLTACCSHRGGSGLIAIPSCRRVHRKALRAEPHLVRLRTDVSKIPSR